MLQNFTKLTKQIEIPICCNNDFSLDIERLEKKFSLKRDKIYENFLNKEWAKSQSIRKSFATACGTLPIVASVLCLPSVTMIIWSDCCLMMIGAGIWKRHFWWLNIKNSNGTYIDYL